MIKRNYQLSNPSGLHARPASKLCAIARKYLSEITIAYDDNLINARNILDVMAANLKQGAGIEISCSGPDEQEAIAELGSFIESLVE